MQRAAGQPADPPAEVSPSPAAALEELLRRPPGDAVVNRKALAGLLVELARNVGPDACAAASGVAPVDPRLEQLRTLLVGREIEAVTRLSEVVEDPEQLAAAVGRVLPAAVASSDARLGQVLAPALEQATERSIRRDPRTLINILHPLIVPAIRKSIGEAIDKTFQSLNESLKHSLTWRGLRWRFEAWWTGTTFAEVVLRHTLVYQVEHAFLIHHQTGLLISHVAAADAASQDPLLVSSMLAAIQDFVRDSFKGAEHHGVDTLRLGDFRLWCEAGPFAMLVAVIRGNPPEELRETLRHTLAQIHAERHQVLESFDGDPSGLADIEASLTALAALRQQQRSARPGFPWLVALAGLLLLGLLAAGGLQWWRHEQLRAANEKLRQAKERMWAGYVERLRATPGIVVTDAAERDGKYVIGGLRDPLAIDPEAALRDAGIDPAQVVDHWQPYVALAPAFVLKRLQASLTPPAGVTLSLSGERIVAEGAATNAWIEHARAVARMMPAGGPSLDLSGVRDLAHGAFAELRRAIEGHEIHFNSGEPLPAPGQDAALDQLAAELKKLASLSAALGVTPRVTLTGHSDDTGPGTLNLSLSLARAGTVLVLLKKRGVDSDMIALHGAGPLEPLEVGASDAARSANRRVSISASFEGQQ
jgi:outer membrane protein OmpA-like peptidoglycan-associated protein